MASAFENAPLTRFEGQNVAGSGEVARSGTGVDQGPQGGRPVISGDAGAGAMAVVDADEEGGAHRFGVLFDHRAECELLRALFGERGADEPGGVVEEERDLLRGDVLGRHDEIALVLSVLIVDDHEDLTAREGLERRGDVRQWARIRRTAGTRVRI